MRVEALAAMLAGEDKIQGVDHPRPGPRERVGVVGAAEIAEVQGRGMEEEHSLAEPAVDLGEDGRQRWGSRELGRNPAAKISEGVSPGSGIAQMA